ncbi:hypothetical protein J6590_072184 [Homalodisca vitripennis]|nr:hypothetical protein J6590_072184 [Homalodisca vitripennis]
MKQVSLVTISVQYILGPEMDSLVIIQLGKKKKKLSSSGRGLDNTSSARAKNRPFQNFMANIEGSAPAPPDGESSLLGPLAALLDACAASKVSPGFGALKGLSKGHIGFTTESPPEARITAPAARARGGVWKHAQKGLLKGHISRSSKTGSESRPTVPAACGRVNCPACGDVQQHRQKGLLKGYISPSSDSGTATRLTVPAASGAFPGLQETVQTLPMAAALPSTDYGVEGKYSLP